MFEQNHVDKSITEVKAPHWELCSQVLILSVTKWNWGRKILPAGPWFT